MVTASAPAFKPHDKVVATEDLPGIPKGTKGTVILIGGIDWIRYRVQFENGVERGMLHGHQIERR